MITIVSPFRNEELIIEASVRRMMANLESLDDEWEYIIVDDGSTDTSLHKARELERQFSRLRVLSYPTGRGRGHAIRFGIAQARGEIIVTTEIDSSWGDEIVASIVNEFQRRPDADIIIASPHLAGGGYRNVPANRVFLSTLGNYIIRAGLTNSVTMNTGMTRGYRRECFLTLPLDEDDKEMHLEIIAKAQAFGLRIYEIPAVLEWQNHESREPAAPRKSSANVNKLIRTHTLFALLAAPFRYIYLVSGGIAVIALGFFIWSVINLLTHRISIYLFLSAIVLGTLSFLIFGLGVLAQQGRAFQRDLWRLRRELRASDLRFKQ
jgi:dolichol-phosphate mannosyltransferase